MVKINWFDAYVTVAVLLELLTMYYWLKLRRKLRPAIWWSAMAAMLLVVLHCAGYWTNSLALSQVTALSNAALVLTIVAVARRGVMKVELLEKAVQAEHQAVEVERGVAHQLSHVLNTYKTKIQYYEDQAARNGLPLYK